jgi:hypothetical protein
LLSAAELGCLSGRPDTALYYLTWLLNVGEYDMIIYDAHFDPDLKLLESNEKWWMLFSRANDVKIHEQLKDNGSIAACVEYQDSLKAWSDNAVRRTIDSGGTATELYRRLRTFDRHPAIN